MDLPITPHAPHQTEQISMKTNRRKTVLAAVLKALEAGKVEIRPGQSNQLHWMSRLAPGVIAGMLHEASRPLIPGEGGRSGGGSSGREHRGGLA